MNFNPLDIFILFTAIAVLGQLFFPVNKSLEDE